MWGTTVCGSLEDIEPGQHILPTSLSGQQPNYVWLSVDEVKELLNQGYSKYEVIWLLL